MQRLSRYSIALAAVASLLGTQAGATALVRQPFLQQVETQRALVVFRTDASCTAAVHYGQSDALAQTATDGTTAAEHAILLTGLSAGSTYAYQVEACGQRLGSAHSFRTAPGRRATTVELAAISDEGGRSAEEVAVGDSILKARPELWLGIGDNSIETGSADEFQTNFFVPLAPLLAEIPVYPSTGNHEYTTDSAQPYLDAFYLPSNNPAGTERYYSFDWGPVHLVSVDSDCAGGWTTACDASALKTWLAADLAATDRPWKIVFFHHPFWSSGEHGSSVSLRHFLGPVLEKNHVDLVLNGHDHDYERSRPMIGDNVADGGITYVVIGTGGVVLRPFATAQPAWSAYRNSTDHGFLKVRIDGGTLTGTLQRPDGAALDTFTLSKPVAAPPAPTLSVTAEPGAGEAPLKAQLSATTDLLSPRITWNFGDGSSGEGAQVTHEFAQPGSYRVVATASSAAEGKTLSHESTVSVGAAGCAAAGTCPQDVSQNPLPSGGGGGCGGGAAAAMLFPLGAGAALRFRRRTRKPR